MTDTKWALDGRLKKAIALEAAIRIDLPHATVDEMRDATPEERADVARLAEVNAPSDETWDLVVLLLDGKPLPEEYQ